MDTLWYYEYIIKIWNNCDSREEIRSGILCADSLTEAAKELEDYYSDEIMEVQMLKAITDGVFEFQYVMEDTDFDFVISRKV